MILWILIVQIFMLVFLINIYMNICQMKNSQHDIYVDTWKIKTKENIDE